MKLPSLVFLLSLLNTHLAFAQPHLPTTAIDGTYYLMTAERSPKGGTTNEMLVQYTERNGQKMLVAAACEEGCTPMIFSYQPDHSESLGYPVFYNSFGYYMVSYEGDSFISVIPDTHLGSDVWRSIRYSNFYSKNAEKAAGMTAEKLSELAIAISQEVMDGN